MPSSLASAADLINMLDKLNAIKIAVHEKQREKNNLINKI